MNKSEHYRNAKQSSEQMNFWAKTIMCLGEVPTKKSD
jgi:hypothetical protein